MKKLLLILIGFCFLTGCSLRERKGEDVRILSDSERDEILSSVRYAVDPRSGVCFAILAQDTDGFRTTFSITAVPREVCGK